MSHVEIVIDELVVRGLSPDAARRAASAFEARLAALADAGDISEGTETFRRLPQVTATSADIGSEVADAVWASLTRRSAR